MSPHLAAASLFSSIVTVVVVVVVVPKIVANRRNDCREGGKYGLYILAVSNLSCKPGRSNSTRYSLVISPYKLNNNIIVVYGSVLYGMIGRQRVWSQSGDRTRCRTLCCRCCYCRPCGRRHFTTSSYKQVTELHTNDFRVLRPIVLISGTVFRSLYRQQITEYSQTDPDSFCSNITSLSNT